MNKFRSLIAVAFLFVINPLVHAQVPNFKIQSTIFNSQSTQAQYVPGEIIVKFKSGIAQDLIDQVNSLFGTSLLSEDSSSGIFRLRIPFGRSVEQMVYFYSINPFVEFAEPNYVIQSHFVPNDPYFVYQWDLKNESGGIKAVSAWDSATGSPSVVVAVVDTGIAYENYSDGINTYYQAPDLSGTTFVPGYDFINNDEHANDDQGHGTHVTGTIAQTTNNGEGAAGIAFNTAIMPVKVLNASGAGTTSGLANGIRWAADHGAHIINMSLGSASSSTTLRNALSYAYSKGVTLIASSGNDDRATVYYPAAYNDYVIAVGATRYDETRAWYSNYGSSLDVVAPGGDLNVDQNGDGVVDGILQQTFDPANPSQFDYYLYYGTSMAAPHVTGIAALLYAQGVATTPVKIREALQSTAKDLGTSGFDSRYGWGLVNAQAALAYNTISNTPPVADPGGPYTATEDVEVQFNGASSYDLNGDALTYSWNFGDSSNGSGVNPPHAYSAGGTYIVSLTVNDGKINSSAKTTTVNVAEVNDAPFADAGGPYTGFQGQTINFDGSGSYDVDGSIASYSWDFGDNTSGTGANPTHAYSTAGSYTVTVTITDNQGLTNSDTASVVVNPPSSEINVFSESFEASTWSLWTQDAQRDWARSSQRADIGTFSAEVDGIANDAQLISIPINLQGRSSATITFKWYIEDDLDTGEYLAFDVSTNNGVTWTEQKRIRGNVDPENVWRTEQVDLTNISNLRIRFRGKMSSVAEDADVDNVQVIAK